MDKLKPCLCRDSKPKLHALKFGNNGLYSVHCEKCGRQTVTYESEKEAIRAWNKKDWSKIPLYKGRADK